ncbi:hypothetical protein [Streptomyces decoyicus]
MGESKSNAQRPAPKSGAGRCRPLPRPQRPPGDDRSQINRVFAVTVEHPESICQDAHVGHRWIDTKSLGVSTPYYLKY